MGGNLVLQRLLGPAMWLANRLSYPGKFLVASLLIMLAVGMLFVRVYDAQHDRIAATRNEQAGLRALEALLQFVQQLQQHRGLSSGLLGGNQALAGRRADLEARTTEKLLEADRQLLPQLKNHMEWQSIRVRWQQLQSEGLRWPQETNYAFHTELIADALLFLGATADQHDLIFDTGADTVYLIDTLVNRVPQALEQLGRIRATGTGILAKREISEKQMGDLLRAMGEMQGNMRMLDVNLGRVEKYNPKLVDILVSHGDKASRAARDITDLVTADILGHQYRTEPVAYFDRVTQVIDTGYALLYQTILGTLGSLLEERIRQEQSQLQQQTAVMGLLLFAIAYLFLGISYSVTANVRILSRRFGDFSEGKLDTRASLDCRDDLALVADGFNAMAEVVARRTAEAEAARTRAEFATQAKSMFLANMSHEIRTPMNAIIGLSHLCQKTDLNRKQHDYLKKIHAAGTSLLGIINDILDFSKIEANKLEMERIPFWLDDVLDNVATVVAHKASEKGIELLIHVKPDTPGHLVGDPLRLAQVLTNLVNNAVKFTEQGQIKLTIAGVPAGENTVELAIDVEDTGIGMTPEQLANLFQAFNQADGSTTRKYGGTGLGLTICKRLVEMMDGEIAASAEPGRGSRFSFTVRLGLGSDIQRRPVPPTIRGLRALIIDDNASAREILAEQLESLELRFDAVGSGEAGLTAVRTADGIDPYKLLFVDWKMPGMSGIETIRALRDTAFASGQPLVIMITAFGAEDILDEAETLGVTTLLVKPFTTSHLWDAVVENLSPDQVSTLSRPRHDRARDVDFSGAGIEILLVEDNEINQQIATELLGAIGIGVILANNGQEAVALLDAAPDPLPWALVLMDLQMPVMDGHQATLEIRRKERFADLPIIALTAHAMAEERERCLAEGMNDHLPKPIDPDQLVDALCRWITPPNRPPALQASDASADDDTSPAEPAIATLRTLADLDIEAGLRLARRNEKLYLSVLRQFATTQADFADRLEQCIAAADTATAVRLAHTLKGLSGQIGASAVQATAAELEAALRADGPHTTIESLRNTVGQRLASLIDQLHRALPAEELVPISLTADPTQLKAVSEALLTQLDAMDYAACQWMDTHQELLRAGLGADYQHIRDAVGDFDFDSASTALKAALSAISAENSPSRLP